MKYSPSIYCCKYTYDIINITDNVCYDCGRVGGCVVGCVVGRGGRGGGCVVGLVGCVVGCVGRVNNRKYRIYHIYIILFTYIYF